MKQVSLASSAYTVLCADILQSCWLQLLWIRTDPEHVQHMLMHIAWTNVWLSSWLDFVAYKDKEPLYLTYRACAAALALASQTGCWSTLQAG